MLGGSDERGRKGEEESKRSVGRQGSWREREREGEKHTQRHTGKRHSETQSETGKQRHTQRQAQKDQERGWLFLAGQRGQGPEVPLTP